MLLARRRCLLALVVACASMGVRAQNASERPARIAIIDVDDAAVRAVYWSVFRSRLAEQGFPEGSRLTMDARFANGERAKLDAIAAEVAATRPDVIVTVTTTVAVAAKKATSTIPIVALGPSDPVRLGLVASLARPGGNVTGVSQNQAEIAGKWLDLVREIAPHTTSIAYLTDRGNAGEMLVFDEIAMRARPLRIKVEAFDAVTQAGVDSAFETIAKKRFDALIVATTTSVLPHRTRIVEAATRARIPAVYARSEYVDAGGLVSYGTDFGAVFARGADYVARILRGAKPADLPFEMASSFQLVLNSGAAQRTGIAIPHAVRMRADTVVP
jgi:putative tryptophan/tyrosine transport system substrate-binding protein